MDDAEANAWGKKGGMAIRAGTEMLLPLVERAQTSYIVPQLLQYAVAARLKRVKGSPLYPVRYLAPATTLQRVPTDSPTPLLPKAQVAGPAVTGRIEWEIKTKDWAAT